MNIITHTIEYWILVWIAVIFFLSFGLFIHSGYIAANSLFLRNEFILRSYKIWAVRFFCFILSLSLEQQQQQQLKATGSSSAVYAASQKSVKHSTTESKQTTTQQVVAPSASIQEFLINSPIDRQNGGGGLTHLLKRVISEKFKIEVS